MTKQDRSPFLLLPTVIEKIRRKLVELKKAHPDNSAGVTTCFSTIQKYLGNVYRDPEQDKFRTIRLSNGAFQQRVAAFTGSIEILELCGFQVHLHPAEQLHAQSMLTQCTMDVCATLRCSSGVG